MESRVSKATLVHGFEVESASLQENRVVLKGEDGRKVEADHVIAATGYRVDLKRLAFLEEKIRNRVRTARTMPILSANFESSLEGLYFAGLTAAGSFGPLMRFVYGAEFAAPRIGQHLVGSR